MPSLGLLWGGLTPSCHWQFSSIKNDKSLLKVRNILPCLLDFVVGGNFAKPRSIQSTALSLDFRPSFLLEHIIYTWFNTVLYQKCDQRWGQHCPINSLHCLIAYTAYSVYSALHCFHFSHSLHCCDCLDCCDYESTCIAKKYALNCGLYRSIIISYWPEHLCSIIHVISPKAVHPLVNYGIFSITVRTKQSSLRNSCTTHTYEQQYYLCF